MPSRISQTPGNIETMQHDCQDLITLFNTTFLTSDNTELMGGQNEPLYQPAGLHNPRHRIYFTHDYFASALHEVAHWCVAGPERRQQVDYGYWYEPDGRTPKQQEQFEQVEIKPQTLEWIFANACHYRFRASVDNVMNSNTASDQFKTNIFREVQTLTHSNLSKRAQRFIHTLATFYHCPHPLAGLTREYLDE